MINGKFHYDEFGRGVLSFIDNVEEHSWEILSENCRTGTINQLGELVTPCPVGMYVLQSHSEYTEEKGMRFNGKGCQKARLYRIEPDGSRRYTKILIHYDEGNNGTMGCIGTTQPVPELYQIIDDAISAQGEIKLEVTRS